jgi:glycosyltransferase involved in cell wall biosynthesis
VATGQPRADLEARLGRRLAAGFSFDLGRLDLAELTPALQKLRALSDVALPLDALFSVAVADSDMHLPFAPALADVRVSVPDLLAVLGRPGQPAAATPPAAPAPAPAPEPDAATAPPTETAPPIDPAPDLVPDPAPMPMPAPVPAWLPEPVPAPAPVAEAAEPPAPSAPARHPDAASIEPLFDTGFYLDGFAVGQRPADPVSHYLAEGWLQGRDPTPWFSTWHYLAQHADVAAAGMNPFLHYCVQGLNEGRALQKLGRPPEGDVFAAHAFATQPGPQFEEFDPTIGVGRTPRAKVLAYYLPQFHPVPVNDRHWGKGFTEWRNLPRALPRFMGHIQPRIPRDLGPYSLTEGDTMRRQIDMARAAGLHGFCFYHYWFDGERVLDAPMERLLADPTLDFPFCLMWANENWTRTWDGAEKEIILRQSYRPEDDIPFVDDLARHMADPRYIRLDGRPLFFIYRPGHIPTAGAWFDRLRTIFAERHGLEPLIFQAQAFGDNDPAAFGADGAIEFPPHKVMNKVPNVSHLATLLDTAYKGDIRAYEKVIEVACDDPAPAFPLIRTVFPSWDNEARRPGRGTIVAGSSPEGFGRWLGWAVEQAVAHPVFGEPVVCINAWNEWAEGAYLEPDVHYGGAYLNALSRVVHGVDTAAARGRRKVLLVGHDLLGFGAQVLLGRIAETLVQQFGCEVAFLIAADRSGESTAGSVRATYEAIGPVTLMASDDAALRSHLASLRKDGFAAAIVNTTVSGAFLPALKAAGFATLSLIHELPKLLQAYRLGDQAGAVAQLADRVIFPAAIVREGFEGFAGPVQGAAEVLPQGLYNTAVLDQPRGDHGLRAELGLPAGTRIVLGVGYADLRKGIDRFVSAGLSVCGQTPDVAFLWVGAAAEEARGWFAPEITAAGLDDRVRILGHRTDVARFFAAADLFYLSSREDPFPSVVIEALAAGLPVVGHAGTGGCDDLIRRHGTLVPPTDPLGAAEAALALLARPDRGRRRAAARRDTVLRDFRFDGYAFGLLERLTPGLSSVSAVVPNYNYERHIGPRLRSVFDQTHPLREVIVLDDASPDGSVTVIREVAAAARRRIALHVNAKNTGSPFAQWRKGAEMATGDYVWIAEADDLADPALVQRLVARMQAAGSAIGFCDSRQIDGEDRPLGDSYRPYMNETGDFDLPLDLTGEAFLHRLAIKNVILNVSAVVFRRDALLAALDTVGEALQGYGVAGDWRLYTEICAAGGGVSWLPDPLNTHRRHATSVTHALKTERHLNEIAAMQRYIADMIPLDAATRDAQVRHLEGCRRHLGVG